MTKKFNKFFFFWDWLFVKKKDKAFISIILFKILLKPLYMIGYKRQTMTNEQKSPVNAIKWLMSSKLNGPIFMTQHFSLNIWKKIFFSVSFYLRGHHRPRSRPSWQPQKRLRREVRSFRCTSCNRSQRCWTRASRGREWRRTREGSRWPLHCLLKEKRNFRMKNVFPFKGLF